MSKAFFSTVLPGLLFVLLVSSCASYRQNIMFQVPEGAELQHQLQLAEKNYVIQQNDFLTMDVYTNGGERIIDPDFELAKDMPVQNAGGSLRPVVHYLINVDGNAKLPMIGLIRLDSLTLLEAEKVLQKEYAKFYTDPFVVLQFQNKRVSVLGAPGGQVIPLVNENVTLVEVLALAKGVSNDAKAQNIRVLRGDEVFVADFSTFESYKKSNMVMEHGDVVYVEPIRRPVSEGVKDYGPVITLLASVTTLIVVLIGL